MGPAFACVKRQETRLFSVPIADIVGKPARPATTLGGFSLSTTSNCNAGRHTEIYRGAEYVVNFLPKLKVEVAVEDQVADKAISAIGNAAKTGQIGDGKIFVTDLGRAVRIRTGETDNDAL